jgi:dolichyl-phosphate beta-glucosyltransferase
LSLAHSKTNLLITTVLTEAYIMEFPMITLIFPAYNEAQRIASTVQEAVDYFETRKMTYEIIVSADGTDGTREKVAELGILNPHIRAIGTPERMGKGHGIREAVRISQGKFIGFSDADNKTSITELDNFLPFLQQGIDVVIGSRAYRAVIERPQPWYRRIGSKGFGVFMHLVTGMWEISDTQCGFKFFQGPVAKDLFARQQIDGYMYDVEILYIAKQSGYRLQQIPVHWRDDGDSRLQLLSGNIRNFWDVIRIRFILSKKNSKPTEALTRTSGV